MNNEQKEYLNQLDAELGRGQRIATTSLCLGSPFVTLVWRITPEQGCTFEILGRDDANAEQILLQQSYRSVWELFANLPLDPVSFTVDPNQEE